MEPHLPAAQDEARPPATVDPERPVVRPSRPVSVALLPLALVTFLVLAFVMAAWTFLHAAV